MTVSPQPVWSAPADADYSAITTPRFMIVKSDGDLQLVGTAGIQADGVMPAGAGVASGSQTRIEWGGIQKIEAGTGGLAVGDKVASDNAGKGVATGADKYHMGKVTKAAAAGEIAQFIWNPGYTKA